MGGEEGDADHLPRPVAVALRGGVGEWKGASMGEQRGCTSPRPRNAAVWHSRTTCHKTFAFTSRVGI